MKLMKSMKHINSFRVYVGVAIAIIAVAVGPMILSSYNLGLLAKYMCFAMVAVGVGLAWGQGGMLTLGQGLFFGLGGYIMAMHMKLDDAGPGGVPDFMSLYGTGSVPWWWEPLRDPTVTLVLIVVVPAAVALLLGWAVFARGVRGAYFAILSQALVAAFAVLLVGQEKSTGGTNGLNNFKGFFGFALNDAANQELLYYICGGVLIGMVLIVRWVMKSFVGKLLVAVRDQENRVKFLGYNPASIKVFAFVLAAVFAAIGGALFVPVVGIISPSDVGVVPSILMLAGVVIGGRTTLLGPVLGTLLVRFAETQLSDSFPSAWTYIEGAIFILVICFLPQGLGGLKSLIHSSWSFMQRGKRTANTAPAQVVSAVSEAGVSGEVSA